jgi:hypothetical protein
LAEAHRDYDGTVQCFRCHPRGGAGTMDARCLDCHTEIGWLRAHDRGVHARVAKQACASCHPDHAGRDFHLVAWKGGSPESFDHGDAGFALEGKHAKLPCRSCHLPKFQRAPVAAMIRVKDKTRSWLGLDPACASCHEDPHRAALGPRCERCHDLAGWKPAPRFDHAKTRYPLTGRHAEVACAKCHEAPELALDHDAEGHAIPRYKPLSFAECAACHRDPHAGRFGPACSKCHGTESFQRVDAKSFDHDKTRYPLAGRHASVPCASCHDPVKAWGAKPAFATCGACHRDAHGGRGTVAGKPADCAACHSVAGFATSTFTVAQHRNTPYPLEGRHATVACNACHRTLAPGPASAAWGTSRVELRPGHAECVDCHAAAHGDQLAARSDHGACDACHGVQGWRPSRFTAREHERLRLPLRGRHAAVACAACHGVKRAGLPPPAGAAKAGSAGFVFTLTELECVACHSDPHRGRFGPRGARPRVEGCLACHGLDSFRPSRVDAAAHATTRFPLDGAHRATPCQACHAELKAAPPKSSLRAAEPSARTLVFAIERTRCADCHDNPHGDQFASRRDHGACESCHGTEAFAPASRFDHDRDAAFKLQGVHARTPCASCHRTERSPGGRNWVRYHGTPARCESCHTTPPATPRGTRIEPGGSAPAWALATTEDPRHVVLH